MAHLAFKKYRLPCASAGQIFFQSRVREGLLALVTIGEETYAGEYAPLRGIHSHSVDDVTHMAQGLKISPDFFHQEFIASSSYPLSYLMSMVHAHYSLLTTLTPKDIEQPVMLSALIDAEEQVRAIENAQHFLAQGYRCLKIKVGKDIARESHTIKTIAALLNDSTFLRLDANKKLSFDDALTLMKYLQGVPIQYFEEPTLSFDDARRLHQACGVAIAIDESFSAPFCADKLVSAGAQFFIIKPSRFLSIYQALALAQMVKRHGIIPIFSTTFESDFTTAVVSLLIAKHGFYDQPHGIFIEGMFTKSPWSMPMRSFRGKILGALAWDFIKAIGRDMRTYQDLAERTCQTQ